LEDYFNSKEQILNKHKEAFSQKKEDIKWIGILVGTGIDDDLKKLIEEGKILIQNNIPVAGIVLNRFRSDSDQIYITTDIYFSQKKGKDYTKYNYNNNSYGKSRLVLAVVKDFVDKHGNDTMDQLMTVFPKNIQGSYGVIADYAIAKEIYDRTGINRHFVDNIITLNNGKRIVVCNEWGKDNIKDFIIKAKELGYNISYA
jgi:hypothetical protein